VRSRADAKILLCLTLGQAPASFLHPVVLVVVALQLEVILWLLVISGKA